MTTIKKLPSPRLWIYPTFVILSFVLTFLHTGPFYGTKIGLVLTTLFQVYLPGLLVARLFGKLNAPHPITRFVWILVAGISVVTCLGGTARLLHISIPVYLLALHGFMLVLTFSPTPAPRNDLSWQLSLQKIPLYLVVLLSCVVVLAVSSERNKFRLNHFPDQTVFISEATWLANDPDDPGLRSRRIDVTVGDSRSDTAGWTYSQAAWVWTSGVSAADIIWFDLVPLFSWTIPLIVFALVYEVTHREQAAVWSTAALVLVGLLTVEFLVYNGPLAFGQSALFQINTLRTFSTALMLPAALFVALSYLQSPRRVDLWMVFIAGLALSTMHPRQIMLFQVSMGATAMLWWLATPIRSRFIYAASLLLILSSLLVLPFIQRLYNTGAARVTENALEADILAFRGLQFIELKGIPIIGDTEITHPASIFYHPIVLVAVLLALILGIGWRKSLAAQYALAATGATLLLYFMPGLAGLFMRIVTVPAGWGLLFALPFALVLGLVLESSLKYLGQIRFIRCKESWLGFGIFTTTLFLQLFEPIPIPVSARDQIRAANQVQAVRNIRPADEILLNNLENALSSESRMVVLAPNRISNYLIESQARTFITGGRRSSIGIAYDGTARFFTDGAPKAPWLDTVDLEFMRNFGVTHIIIEADDTRLTQLLLYPERFELLDTPAGYVVFRLYPVITPGLTDNLFERMNTLYSETAQPRWGRDGFALTFPGDAIKWEPIADEWKQLLSLEPNNDVAREGLAFSYMMMGADDLAFPLWRILHSKFPDVSLYTDAFAYSEHILGSPEDGLVPLFNALSSNNAATRVLAVRTLLTESFFYLLSPTQREAVIAVTEISSAVWDELAVLDRPDAVRKRVSLLMNAGIWQKAREWLNSLPEIELSPYDVVAAASIDLVKGEIDSALSLLQLSTDPDWLASKVHTHADRWQNNVAAQVYYLLLGERAFREENWAEAEKAFRQAITLGAAYPGRYFLARTLEVAGQNDRAKQLLEEVAADWNASYHTPFPELVSMLAIADYHSLYVMQPEVRRGNNENTLVVTALYGNPKPGGNAYPIQTWLIQVMSPDSNIHFASSEIPAISIDGALVRASFQLTLPPNIEPLTQALVYIEPRHNNAVTSSNASVGVALNRPPSAPIPVNALPLNLRFGADLELQSLTTHQNMEEIRITLFWRALAPPSEDYQVFVHVLNDEGQIVSQRDSGPVDGRYPTSQWRTETTIADTHIVQFDSPLDPGKYEVRVGLYRLSDGSRLSISPGDERVEDNSLLIYSFEK